MLTKRLVYILIVFLIFTSCSKKNRFVANISDSKIEIEIKRLDTDIFEMDPTTISDQIPNLLEKYGYFFELYSSHVLKMGSPYQKNFSDLLNGFVTDFTMNNLFVKTTEVFPNLNLLEKQLNNGFKRYNYFFPEKKVPGVYTFIGGFNQSIVVADSILGIGLDKYLGSDCVYYDRLGIANYLQQNMNPENASVDAIKSWILTEFEYNDSLDNLVNNLIYQGKVQFLLNVLLPEVNDSLKFGFKGSDLRWCIVNENQMWNYLIEQKVLFSTDYMIINKHINQAPFTSGFSTDSPGRASVWLGWRIVFAYMQRNPKVSIQDLMFDDDYQKILSQSRYEP